jgi:hypothetical protein
MDLILALEQKFAKINNQLASRSKDETINSNYSKDLKAIHSFFDSTKEKEYENGLNERRDEMLRQLIRKRNEQLEQINEFIQSSQQNSPTQFKTLADTIKLDNLQFSRGIPSVNEFNLLRTKLDNQLNLTELGQYVHLMSIDEQLSLAKVKHQIEFSFYYHVDVHVLPSNLIFIYSTGVKNMIVLNKSLERTAERFNVRY